MVETEWWEVLAAALIIPALAYLMAYLVGAGWGSAWFGRKMRHHREVLKEIERSGSNGKENEEEES